MAQRSAAKKTSGGKKAASKKSGKSTAAAAAAAPAPRRREVLGILLLTFGLGLMLAVGSFSPRDAAFLESGKATPHNLIGPVGHRLAEALLTGIGVGALVVGLSLLAMAWAMFARRTVHVTVVEGLGWVGLVLSGTILAHLVLPELRPFDHAPGGVVGLVGGEFLRSYLATVGAVIVAAAGALLSLVLASDFTVARGVGALFRALGRALGQLGALLRDELELNREGRARRAEARAEAKARARLEREARAEEKRAARARKAEAAHEPDDRGIFAVPSEERVVQDPEPAEAPPPRRRRRAQLDPPPPAPLPVALPARPSGAAAIAPRDDLEAEVAQYADDFLSDPTHADPDWAASLQGLKPPPGGAGGGTAAEAQATPEAGAANADAAQTAAGTDVATGPEVVAPATETKARRRRRRPSKERAEAEAAPAPDAEPQTGGAAAAPAEATPPAGPAAPATPAETDTDDEAAGPGVRTSPRTEAEAEGGGGPTIVESKAADRTKARQDSFAFTTHGEKFVRPGLDLLDEPPADDEEALDRSSLHETAKKLTQKLADFGITGEVQKIRLGPVVTMYEFVPGPGVKISKIAGLADDLAMAMEALRVRIVAPLPGKGAVGIEVPNRKRKTVFLREILEQDTFLDSKGKLTLAMGKDVEGLPFYVDLAQMPHLLIAGTTGSGKSVSVNAMITSILYRSTPDDVRFIMVDPKWTELSLYDGIPHLLLPVVKDPAKAALALRWAVEEMERRYQLLADLGVRSLAGFNREAVKLRKAWEERQAALEPLPPLEDADGDHERYMELKQLHEERILADPEPPEKLPLIVIVIDELADLMMVAGREVETYIARIAQKARAAGLHLMVATQRPSTDVLTGLIKVNFPARIGFRVASRHDSQTIINGPGSEKLLGKGDMLMIPPGQSDPLRVHGAFVSDDEIKRVVSHLKEQGRPIYDESILKPRDEDGGDGFEDDDGTRDAKWDEAVYMVSERDTISVSFLQRRLGIGYNRAARMIEQMERDGIVGPADGTKPREVLIQAPPD